MTTNLSPNTQAILLLTAPLTVGRARMEAALLKPAEYRTLARLIHSRGSEPADLLSSPSADLLEACEPVAAADRLRHLLGRGFQLSQAVDRWSARSIWVVSRADGGYPRKLRGRLREHAPPVLYGCGQLEALDTPGLAIVGSRRVDEELLRYTEDTGQLTARAGWAVVSGGARGVDQAAMRGGLEAGGKVIGILADRLESAALQREHRSFLMDGQLVLVSPYDPAAGFNVGNAMARNRLIYAQAEAALVVNADYQKGGTWAGAVEQLRSGRGGPVYVRPDGGSSRGLRGLQEKGALSWPEPATPDELVEVLEGAAHMQEGQPSQAELDLTVVKEPGVEYEAHADQAQPSQVAQDDAPPASPAAELKGAVRGILAEVADGRGDAAIAAELAVPKVQAHTWLREAVEEGVLTRERGTAQYAVLVPVNGPGTGDPAAQLLQAIEAVLNRMSLPTTAPEFAQVLDVSLGTARGWLHALQESGVMVRSGTPVRYAMDPARPQQASLFAEGDSA